MEIYNSQICTGVSVFYKGDLSAQFYPRIKLFPYFLP